nr:MAG TPA: hypothetical protein [Caudoviricetes sp.]
MEFSKFSEKLNFQNFQIFRKWNFQNFQFFRKWKIT